MAKLFIDIPEDLKREFKSYSGRSGISMRTLILTYIKSLVRFEIKSERKGVDKHDKRKTIKKV